MNESLIWLNRTGIILNFVAGFFLAPELIGIKRLQKLESSIEAKLNTLDVEFLQYFKTENANKKSEYSNSFLLGIIGIVLIFLPILFIVVILLIPSTIGFASYFAYRLIFTTHPTPFIKLIVLIIGSLGALGILAVIGVALGGLLLITSSSNKNPVQPPKSIFKRLVLSIANTYKFAFSSILISIIIMLLPNLIVFLKFLVKDFKEHDRVQSSLVWLGIAFFVTGNLFQLIATF